MWIWRPHSSIRYTVSSAYQLLTEVFDNEVVVNNYNDLHFILWLSEVPLKVSLFAWRLLQNQIPTKDNLVHRQVLPVNDQLCTWGCGSTEDRDHLFVLCAFYGNIWVLICGWLGFRTVSSLNLLSHMRHFYGLGGGSKFTVIALKMIWLATVYVIWKEINERIFRNNEASIHDICEHVKLTVFWWFKQRWQWVPIG